MTTTLQAAGRIGRQRGRTTTAVRIWPAAAFLAVIVGTCVVAPVVASSGPAAGADIASADLPMWSAHHLFGTDMVGNDLLSRVLLGGRLSLEIALASNVVGLVLGGLLGISAAHLGGVLEQVTTVVLDVLVAFPSMVLVLVIAAGLGPGEWQLIAALSFLSLPSYARMARASTLQVGQEPYVRAAQLCGVSRSRVIATHLVPNVAPRLITYACLGMSAAIMVEASLSFLGLGLRPPAPSWGTMIMQGQEYLTTRPRLVLVPSACLTATVLALNLLGDAGRRRLATR